MHKVAPWHSHLLSLHSLQLNEKPLLLHHGFSMISKLNHAEYFFLICTGQVLVHALHTGVNNFAQANNTMVAHVLDGAISPTVHAHETVQKYAMSVDKCIFPIVCSAFTHRIISIINWIEKLF